MNDKPLKGKVALVTGASRGIGKAIAKGLYNNGADLICVSRSLDALEVMKSEIKDEFPSEQKIDIHSVDIAKSSEIDDFLTELPSIDILVNNAGITRDSLLMRATEEDWNNVINTNLTASFKITKAVIRAMMKNKWGRIINISSVVGLMGNPGQTNYAASKAGLIGFSKSLAKEVGSRGITVNAVAPGYIETDMTEKLTDEQKEAVLKNVPIKRLGTVEDIAEMVLFLASQGDYITGQVFSVDGGMYI